MTWTPSDRAHSVARPVSNTMRAWSTAQRPHASVVAAAVEGDETLMVLHIVQRLYRHQNSTGTRIGTCIAVMRVPINTFVRVVLVQRCTRTFCRSTVDASDTHAAHPVHRHMPCRLKPPARLETAIGVCQQCVNTCFELVLAHVSTPLVGQVLTRCGSQKVCQR